jgi:hypothetical protein
MKKNKKEKEKGKTAYISLIVCSSLVAHFLRDLQSYNLVLDLHMCMPAVLVAHFLRDLYLGYIEVAQRPQWLVMRLL